MNADGTVGSSWAPELGVISVPSSMFAPERFESMRTPTRLLVGGDSPPRELTNATGVADALADARVVVMPGQQHLAMYAAPDDFVREVSRLLEE